jgi:Family of unknown function (DUF6270)
MLVMLLLACWMGRTFAIFGSCVTRDPFELTEASIAGHRVALHLMRTTINSCLAIPVPLSDLFSRVSTASFDDSCVMHDLLKQHFDQLRQAKFDCLLLDLVDERHCIIAEDDYYMCQSVPFLRMAEKLKLNVAKFTRRSPRDPELIAETLANIPRFIKRLCCNVNPSRILVHEALAATKYFDSEGVLRTFPNEAEIKLMNDILREYYNRLKLEGGFFSITLPADICVAHVGHRWMLSPFHYTDIYYHYFLDNLKQFMK